MLVRLTVLTLGFIALGFAAHAQQFGPATQQFGIAAPPAPAAPAQAGSFFVFDDRQEDDPSREIRRKVIEATSLLKKAEGSDNRAKALDNLEAALQQEYDAHMDAFEKQIDEMEQQISEMRKKLSRRREAKADMVKLRIQLLEAEADDLGWPAAVNSHNATATWAVGLSSATSNLVPRTAKPLRAAVQRGSR